MTMTTATNGHALSKPDHTAAMLELERVIIDGDLAKLSPADRVAYYLRVCESLGLNAATRPFDFMKDKDGKLRLYARKDCTEQLRNLHDISVKLEPVTFPGCVAWKAHATKKGGRFDESIGAVPSEGLKGESLANAIMKAETKAKRRVTLSICGLGFVSDETEIDSIPGAQRVTMTATGEIVAPPAPPKSAPAPRAPSPLSPAQEALVNAWEEKLLLANTLDEIQAVTDEGTEAVRKGTIPANAKALSNLRKLKEERIDSIKAVIAEERS